MIEETGLHASTKEKFRLWRPHDKWTVPLFELEFQIGNKERLRQLTAGNAGFQLILPSGRSRRLFLLLLPPPSLLRQVHPLPYCWTHGLNAITIC